MKSKINKIRKLIFSKTTLFTLMISWIVIVSALYYRGSWKWDGHFASDSVFFQLIVILNFPALLLASPVLSEKSFFNEGEPLKDALIFIITITIQWIVAGCIIKAAFFKGKKNID